MNLGPFSLTTEHTTLQLGPFSLVAEHTTLQLGPFSISTAFGQVPVISLIGAKTINVVQGSTFYDPGVTVVDEEDLSASVIVTGTVDIQTPGIYTIRYNVTDGVGNQAEEVTRFVIVEELIVSIDDQVLSNLKKYFIFTSEETTDDIGWSHRSFENDAITQSFGETNNQFETYMYGQKILGLGISKSGVDTNFETNGFLLLADEIGLDSISNHIDPNKPLIEKINLYNRLSVSNLSQIQSSQIVPDITMDFSNSIESTGNRLRRTDEKRDFVYISDKMEIGNWSNLEDAQTYIAEVEVNQQILKAEYSSVPHNRFHPKPLRDAIFIPELLKVKPATAILFYQRENEIELNVSYKGKPVDLSIFDRFVFTSDEVMIDSTQEPNLIMLGENEGEIRLNLKDKFSQPGKRETQLIGYSPEYTNGVVLWDKSLRNANFTINVFAI